jgi:hypothetical protein
MDNKIIFIKTPKGESELSSMSGDMKRVMLLINEKATLGEITRRAPPSLRGDLHEIIQQLIDAELIRDKDKHIVEPKIASPKGPPAFSQHSGSNGELDFTSVAPTPGNSPLADDAAKKHARLEAEAKSKLEAELVAGAKAEAEAKAMHEAELAATAQAEAIARAQRAEEARLREAQEAARAKAELEEAARVKAEADARVRAEIEAAVRAKQDAEAKARREAEATRIAAEIEAARIQAHLEAVAKANAELEAARIRAEQEAARLKQEEDLARARAEAEERARQEKARLKVEQEAERIRAEQQAAARAQAVAEEQARQEAEANRAAEQLAARIKAEQAAAELLKIETDKRIRQEAEAARLKAETEAARIKAEQAEAEQLAALASAKLEAERAAISVVQATLPEAKVPETTPADVTNPTKFAIKLDAFDAVSAQSAVSPPQSQPVVSTQPEIAAYFPSGQITAPSTTIVEKVAEQKIEQVAAAREIEHLKNVHVANWQRDKQSEVSQEQALADEQAKAWAEAELRSKLQAKLDAEQTAQQAALAKAKSVQKPVVRARRRPLPLAKIASTLTALALLIVIALPYFWPMQEFIPQLEKKLSAQLNQPVRIGGMRAASLPPKLELQFVNLGNEQEVKVASVVISFDLMSIFSEQKKISNIDLKGITLDGQHLDQEVRWLTGLGSDAQYPLRHLTIQNLQVIAEGIPLPQLSGSAELDSGEFTRVVLHSDDDRFSVELLPKDKHWQLNFGIKESTLPLLADVMFSDFGATGLIGNNELDFNEIIAHAYGGIVSGSGKLSWRKGWQIQGHIQAKAMELEKLFPQNGITGEVFTEGNFSAQSAKLLHLGDAPRLDVSFEAKKGVINGLDIVETARLSSHIHLPGGRTHYEEFTGALQLEERNIHFRQVKIISGILNASGAFDISHNNNLSGSLNSEIKMREGNIPLVVSGTLTEPKLVAR